MAKKGIKRKAGGGPIAKFTRGLPIGAELLASDNSGARLLNLIAVKGAKTRLSRIPSAKIGDLIICSVTKGSQKIRRQIVHAVVVRQRQRIRRSDGTIIAFYDNAAVVTNEIGDPKGSEIRGAVAKEAAERFPRIASTATMII
ncbi:MAG: 50S ribosomal protein L14 [Candidatus Heimdallarchaeota archaeon LC_3]|uniref:Putative 50S ribosomal protein L14 n=1 Tax=uncultured organism TaxID=155900 RepID=A0A0F6PZZ7_9ZZZZ|nr:putative 50S ribosomal protein L14 [uncultured organism]OLS22808.1 MAG: 50S ribosomal protein L14 [Candidatus Heimdallarchaeota archaeon LC_3]